MSTPGPYQTLVVDAQGGVLTVLLSRPALRNAMSLQMVDELHEVLAAAEAAGGVRVIVLRGAGGHFCSGADHPDMGRARQLELAGDGRAIAAANARFGTLCGAWARTGIATVAVLEGTVMGGGLGLACVVDVALAGRGATLRLPETVLGIVPAQVAPFLVERVGASQARRLAVTGGTLDAGQALAIGLVHEVHDDGAALDEAIAGVVTQILRCAPQAIAATKALVARARHAPAGDLVDDAAQVFAKAARSAEASEGMSAFMARRAPAWAPR